VTEYAKKPLKKKLCDEAVKVLVQIPPGIFAGIDSLAWPVSLGLCATMNKCTTPCCVENAAPEQVHLSLASSDRSLMGVSWVTLTGDASQVRYGLSVDNLDTVVDGTSLTYDKAGWVGMIHRGVMTGLKEGTRYYYQVGADDGGSGWSEVFSFQTFAPRREINFAVIADMAYDENSDDTVAQMSKLVDDGKLDVVIHSGDISYADGYMPHFDAFMNKVQPIASRIPYMVTPGNHEFGYLFAAYKARFFMPGVIDEGGSGDGMYYDWTYGKIHFSALNTESAIDTPMFSHEEKVWAKKDLSLINRKTHPWSIAHFHRPLYCAKDDDCGKMLMKQGLEDLLVDSKVDIVLVGHEHTYERTHPVKGGEKQEPGTAPVYMMQGSSGNREGNSGTYPPLSELPAWVANVHNNIGLGVLTQSFDGKSLLWSFYDSATMEKLDEEIYIKNDVEA
jgi:acid phosphatase type 7